MHIDKSAQVLGLLELLLRLVEVIELLSGSSDVDYSSASHRLVLADLLEGSERLLIEHLVSRSCRMCSYCCGWPVIEHLVCSCDHFGLI